MGATGLGSVAAMGETSCSPNSRLSALLGEFSSVTSATGPAGRISRTTLPKLAMVRFVYPFLSPAAHRKRLRIVCRDQTLSMHSAKLYRDPKAILTATGVGTLENYHRSQ